MKKILIVDDSPTIRRMVRTSLQTVSDAEIIEASSGLEAVEKVALDRIDLMVLDMNMPDMHGLEVLRFIRSHSAYRQIPVIVLTTKSDEETRHVCLDAGASAYLTKPFNPQELADQAKQLVAVTAHA